MINKTFLHFPNRSLKRVIVLGLAPQLLALSNFCEVNDVKLEIYTGERHRNIRLLTGETLDNLLEEMGRKVYFCDDLEGFNKGPYKTADVETLIISFGAPFIIKQSLIDLYGGRVINSHGAPLPEFRGGGGLSWRFLAGDTRGATLFHRVTTIIDDGPILYRKDFQFPWPVQSIKEWMIIDQQEQESGLLDFLDRLLAGEKFLDIDQDKSLATYFPRLNTDLQGFIDFRWPGEMISRFIGAFSEPYSGASTFVKKNRVRILSADFVRGDTDPQHPFLFGLVIRVHLNFYWVICRNGFLKIPTVDLKSTCSIKEGDRLHTPASVLDDALSTRVIYTAQGLK